MRSSTSSSDTASGKAAFGRPLPDVSLKVAAWIALLICLLFFAAWELYLRADGVEPGYANSAAQWAIERRRIDNGEGDRTVLTGSSRTLFNVQLDVWEQASGRRPLQLALEGTTPLPVMEGLASDDDFSGMLIVGVAPGLFFSGFEYRADVLAHFGKESPSQWLGQRISMLLEPYLAFYTYDYALFTIVNRQPWPTREGVFTFRDVRQLSVMARDRNTRMLRKVIDDADYQQEAKDIWMDGFKPIDELPPEELQARMAGRDKQLQRAIEVTLRLQERGIEVVFVRHPSEGHYAIADPMYTPRALTWDVLIEKTGALGLHWQDHEEMQGYYLPEWSHMTPADADRYTAALHGLIERKLAERKAIGTGATGKKSP